MRTLECSKLVVNAAMYKSQEKGRDRWGRDVGAEGHHLPSLVHSVGAGFCEERINLMA